MRAYALIPARSGSTGLPNKNIKLIAGHPLLAYSIAFAKKLDFERIIVSTDSEHYRQIALQYGAECPYLRGENASRGNSMEESIFADLADNLPRYGIALPEIWARLKPTNPFRSVTSVRDAFQALRSDPQLELGADRQSSRCAAMPDQHRRFSRAAASVLGPKPVHYAASGVSGRLRPFQSGRISTRRVGRALLEFHGAADQADC